MKCGEKNIKTIFLELAVGCSSNSVIFSIVTWNDDHDDPMYNVTDIFQVEKSRKFQMFQ